MSIVPAINLLCNQTIVKASIDTMANATNCADLTNSFNEQASWSKDSIMTITFGISGTILGVAAVFLGVHKVRDIFKRRNQAGAARDEEEGADH